jgi:PTH1 family peptidyl-tRNA hydrolase
VILIVGLGNPGPHYETTRHNAGFLMVDLLIEHFRATGESDKFGSKCTKGEVFGSPCLFIKPQTFMNLSGRSVGQAMAFYKIKPAQVIVIFDDIDQAMGKVKARTGGGHGGHNGVRSLIECIGGDAFHRIKLGVGRPTLADDKRQQVSDWVLSRLSDDELRLMQEDMFDEVLLRLKQLIKPAGSV